MADLESAFDFLEDKPVKKHYPTDYSSEEELALRKELELCGDDERLYSKELKRYLLLRKKFDNTPDTNPYNDANPH